MKYILFCLSACLIFLSFEAFAQEIQPMPFASEISTPIKHYNKIRVDVATSGVVSKGGYKELAAKGVQTFIDLRTPEEIDEIQIQKEFDGLTAQYHNIPVFGSEGISEDQVDAFTKIFKNSEKPVLINCGSGNRAGALWAAFLLQQGERIEVALEEGRTSGMKSSLEEDVKSKFCKKC